MTPNKNLPILKSSPLMAKTLISLSKVDLDANHIHKNRVFRTSTLLEKEIPRSQSGLTLRKNRSPETRGRREQGAASIRQAMREGREE